MIEYTDKEIGEQLQKLYQKIIAGISYAEDILNKAQQINSAVENQLYKAEGIKSEISAIAATSKDIGQNVNNWQTEIQAIHHNVVKIGYEINHNQSVDNLQQEFTNFSQKLREFHSKILQIDETLPGFEIKLNQGLIAIQQLVEKSETDKTELVELVQQLDTKVKEIFQITSQITQLRKVESILEIMAAEVSTLARELKADRAALASLKTDLDYISTTGDNSLQELRTEIEYIQQQLAHNLREIGEKLQKQAKNQQRFRNWLLGITFGVACLGFALILIN